MVREKSPRNRGRYSPRAPPVAIGLEVSSLKLLEPVRQKVVILQKSPRHTPAQKLRDAFIAILAGAHGLSGINTRARGDEAFRRAFGRGACAYQSVVQGTLNACTGLNVRQMKRATDVIFRRHGQGSLGVARRDFELELPVVEAIATLTINPVTVLHFPRWLRREQGLVPTFRHYALSFQTVPAIYTA